MHLGLVSIKTIVQVGSAWEIKAKWNRATNFTASVLALQNCHVILSDFEEIYVYCHSVDFINSLRINIFKDDLSQPHVLCMYESAIVVMKSFPILRICILSEIPS